MFFDTLERRSDQLEILDKREATQEEVDANFAEIARVNRYLGGTRAVASALKTLLRSEPAFHRQKTLRVLDIATGGADIPRSLVRQARGGKIYADVSLRITATDISTGILEHARRMTSPAEYPEIEIERADALNLPYADQSFDVATCSMAMHHFAPELCRNLMREMARVSRRGFIINDLRRDRLAFLLIWVLTRLLRAHPITQHDAPLSVRRAYNASEIETIARIAGIPFRMDVYAAPYFRVVLIAQRVGGSIPPETA